MHCASGQPDSLVGVPGSATCQGRRRRAPATGDEYRTPARPGLLMESAIPGPSPESGLALPLARASTNPLTL